MNENINPAVTICINKEQLKENGVDLGEALPVKNEKQKRNYL